MDRSDAARALVDRIIHIYPSTVGIIGPDYDPGQRLVAAIAQALAEARRAALAEAAKRERTVKGSLEKFLDLVSESRGVDGYHLNGDVAQWDEFDWIQEAVQLRTAAGTESWSDVDPK